MGHNRIGTLPAQRSWRDLIALIAEGAAVERVAEATTHAWQKAFNTARNDAGFREAVWLMAQFGTAGRSQNPLVDLAGAGVEATGANDASAVAIAVSEAMDRRLAADRARTDFGELAHRAIVGAVSEQLRTSIGDRLLPSGVEEVRGAVRKCGNSEEFGKFVRTFFGRFSRECMEYFLSKTLPAQVGEGQRFTTTKEYGEFVDALRTHCTEAAEIVKTFGGDWLGKHLREGGGKISREKAEKFGWYGLEKMRREFEVRARANVSH